MSIAISFVAEVPAPPSPIPISPADTAAAPDATVALICALSVALWVSAPPVCTVAPFRSASTSAGVCVPPGV